MQRGEQPPVSDRLVTFQNLVREAATVQIPLRIMMIPQRVFMTTVEVQVT